MSVFQKRVGLISAIEGASLVAETEVVLVGGHGLVDGKAAQLEFRGASDGIGGNDVSGEIADDQAERVALDADIKRRGTETDGIGS